MMDDTSRFLNLLSRDLFDATQPLFVARAPGRLDVMGGISDYSGGLCLEWPLGVATHCALQLNNSGKVEVISGKATAEGWTPCVAVSRSDLRQWDCATARSRLAPGAGQRWARYVLGAFIVLHRETETGLPPLTGARIVVASDVPLGVGIASSASLEVSAMSAVCAAWNINLDGLEMARLCQKVENEVVGAPCGIMDQVTVALGRQNHLLRLLCRPHEVQGFVALPADVALFGIDSNVKHSIGGSAYGKARCAAFMGRRILNDLLPAALSGTPLGTENEVNVADRAAPCGRPYVANLSPDVWRAVRAFIPETMSGTEFVERYEHHGDAATSVQPDETYPVRLATEHPIYEIDRTRRFAEMLAAAQYNEAARAALLTAAGDLMVQSHFSYDHRCNLGAPETDLIVRLARERGTKEGILGAKITGGGAGGTVAILGDRRSNANLDSTVQAIADDYAAQSGRTPHLFSGSSDGAVHRGVRTVSLERRA